MRVLLVATTAVMFLTLCSAIGQQNFLRNLYNRGKTFWSRSVELRKNYDEVDPSDLYPEHRDVDQKINPETSLSPQHGHVGQKHSMKKHRNKYADNTKILYHTHVYENDNLDLYSIIGGLSFASLLVTTVFVLGRRNGSLIRSLDDSYRSDAHYRHINSKKWSTEEIMSSL